MTENIISDKMKRSIYLDYPDYKDEAFSHGKKFGVYIPKLNDQVSELIAREEAKSMYSKSRGAASDPHAAQHGDQAVPSQNIFANSVRAVGCPQCNGSSTEHHHEHADQNGNQHYQDAAQGCGGCGTHHCCCKNRFRIRRSNSKCDSAYSKDTNTMKSLLHGKKYGYYLNQPYSQIGSNFFGSRYYKDHPLAQSQGPMLTQPCTKGPMGTKFEDELLKDPRTGQKMGQRSVNPVMNTILRESCQFNKNRAIQDGIMRLKQTGCLNVPCEKIKTSTRVKEKGYVYNDYHSKESKNGYSRGQVGGYPYK